MEGNYKYWFDGVKYTAKNKEEADAHCEQLQREKMGYVTSPRKKSSTKKGK